MKKSLFIAIFSLVFLSPSLVKAQVAATPTDVQSIVQMITDLQVQLLLAKIAELKQQIADLMAAQQQTTTKVDTMVQNTTPTGGATTGTIATPTYQLSFGDQFCELYNWNENKTIKNYRIDLLVKAEGWDSTNGDLAFDVTVGGIKFEPQAPNGMVPEVAASYPKNTGNYHGWIQAPITFQPTSTTTYQVTGNVSVRDWSVPQYKMKEVGTVSGSVTLGPCK